MASSRATEEMRLHDVIVHGTTRQVESMLDEGADPNTENCDGQNTLLAALLNGRLHLIELLLSHGTIPNSIRRRTHMTPLLWAVGHRNFALVNTLLGLGADPNTGLDTPRGSAFMRAIELGDRRFVKLMIECSAEVNKPNEEMEYPIDIALANLDTEVLSMMEVLEILDLLLNNGVNVRFARVYPYIPIQFFRYGRGTTYMALKEQGMKVMEGFRLDENPLILSVISRDISLTKALITEEGIDVNSRDAIQETVMHRAVRFANLPLMKMLLKLGANIDAVNRFQLSPLMLLARSGEVLPEFAWCLEKCGQSNIKCSLEFLIQRHYIRNAQWIVKHLAAEHYSGKIKTVDYYFQDTPRHARRYFEYSMLELHKMSSTYIENSFTLYDMLILNKRDRIVRKMYVKLFMVDCQLDDEFPIFAQKIKHSYESARNYQYLLDKNRDKVAFLTGFDPVGHYYIIDNILANLKMRDLDNLYRI